MRKPNLPQRRAFLGALATLPASAAAVAAPIDTPEQANKAAEDLAHTMARLHGGRWNVTIDHENGFILIMQRGERLEGGAA